MKNLNENKHFKTYEDSFLWLKNAEVAIPVFNVEEPKLPLLLSKQRNLFKLFMNDVGLLACQYAEDIQLKLLSDDNNINFGSVYENFVTQELNVHGFSTEENSLFYFNSKKQGELDFVIEYNSAITPIEVKSGKYYIRHNALSNVLNNNEYEIKQAIILCQDNVEIRNNLVYLPIYMTMFLEKNKIQNLIYKFDLEGLR